MSSEWFPWVVIVFFAALFGLFAWYLSLDWVPFGSDFTFIDGVLRVRSTYNVLWWIVMICVGCKASWLALLGFIRLKKWTPNNYLAAAFTVFFVVLWISFTPVMAHAFLSLKCTSQQVAVKQKSDYMGEIKQVLLDYPCVRATELRAHPTKPVCDVVVHLEHSRGCGCCTEVSDEHSKRQKQIKSVLLYLDYDYFLFDAGVFAHAIATGKIDMSKQGLKEGLFSCL